MKININLINGIYFGNQLGKYEFYFSIKFHLDSIYNGFIGYHEILINLFIGQRWVNSKVANNIKS